jgi:hypothetical protein
MPMLASRLFVGSPFDLCVTRALPSSRSGGDHRRQEARIIWAITDEEHLSHLQLLRRRGAPLPFPVAALKTPFGQAILRCRESKEHKWVSVTIRHFTGSPGDLCCHEVIDYKGLPAKLGASAGV